MSKLEIVTVIVAIATIIGNTLYLASMYKNKDR